jgi:uncharacterized protein (TIGR02270 family)
MSARTSQLPLAPIEDIVEEHLAESSFYLERWDRALTSARLNLAQLRDGPEELLLAHVDGVAVGGRKAADRLLWPMLEKAEGWAQVGAAALALLAMPEKDFARRLVAQLSTASGTGRSGVVRALELAWTPGINRLLMEAAHDLASDLCLGILAERGVDPGLSALPYLQQGKPEAICVALRAIRWAKDRAPYLSAVERFLRAPDLDVRLTAIETGLLWALPAAQAACMELAAAQVPQALLLSALLARPGFEKPIFAALEDSRLRDSALWALGFTGTVASAERALAFMDAADRTTSRLAGEAFSSITGLPLDPGFALTTPEAEEALAPSPHVDELPLPNRDAVACWWSQNRSRLAAQGRLLHGEPWRGGLPLDRIEALPMRRRHAVLIEQAIVLRGAGCFVAQRVLSRVQGEQTLALQRLATTSPAS